MFKKELAYKHRRMRDVACYVLEIKSCNEVATTMNVSWVNLHAGECQAVGVICVRTEEFPEWDQIKYGGRVL